jgi:hypothetical protein
MGFYVNPKGQTKEEFLKQNGTQDERPDFEKVPTGHMLVVLVNNGWMTAAGIIFDENEFKAATDPSDPRPKIFYHVPVSALQKL